MDFPKQPEGVELLRDVSPARWIEECLWPWGTAGVPPGTRVGSLVPEGFASYCRVFHPAWLRGSNQPVRWSTVASWTGRTVHPLMQFERIVDIPDHGSPAWGSSPRTGSLEPEECRILADLLEGFTATPRECYFCVWEGYGFVDPHHYRNVPRVNVPNRVYLLFRGPLEAIMSFANTFGWAKFPNIWWPADWAWCVASEIDLFDTYIGGSDACIEAILGHPALEALSTSIEARVDLGGDTINV